MDRREVLGAGLLFGAGVMALGGEAEAGAEKLSPVPDQIGTSVGRHGVFSDEASDQTQGLQHAVSTIGGHRCVVFPAGSYKTERLRFVEGQTILGAPGQSVIVSGGQGPMVPVELSSDGTRGEADKIRFYGLDFFGFGITNNGLVHVKGGCCRFENCRFYGAKGPGLIIEDAQAVEIVNCTFRDCEGGGLRLANAAGRGQAAMVLQNRFDNCGAVIDGPAVVTNNIVSGAPKVGLMLGGKRATGQIMAAHNFISGCSVGFGVAAEGDGYYMLALNLVNGAKDGAIRAFDKGKPIGPDLARASAEAFRHLGMFGNVAQ